MNNVTDNNSENTLDYDKISNKVLLVDDNDNLLASIKRQFRKQIKLETANSGALALELINNEGPYAVVISDMQMPEMDGITFLSKVRNLSAKTTRIMLTGNANMDVAIDGINKGNLFRFLTKPVAKELLLSAITDGLNQYKLLAEREQLFTIVNSQNKQLKDLNQNLEEKVRLRTADLNKANETLKKQNIEVIMTFSKIIELRPGIEKEHAKYIAQKASAIGEKMGMGKVEAQDTLIAGLLLQIGKMSLPERLITRPLMSLTSVERDDFRKHAVKGQALLSGLAHLKQPALYIRGQFERYNGSGTPDALIGEAIPLASRILAVIQDYLSYTGGLITGKKLLGYEVENLLLKNKGKAYDPKVVDLFLESITTNAGAGTHVVDCEWFELQPGMQIAEVKAYDAVYCKNQTVTKKLIEEIKELRKKSGDNVQVRVRVRNG
jgi:response regulator RpfG family c-di-GMP phosphodiesterase